MAKTGVIDLLETLRIDLAHAAGINLATARAILAEQSQLADRATNAELRQKGSGVMVAMIALKRLQTKGKWCA